VLFVNATPALWENVLTRLRPFVARQVPAADLDDVLQDVFIRMQRGLSSIREDERRARRRLCIAPACFCDAMEDPDVA
jgi:DNA-directed RNA polymerase specialized sigma24 family protein